MDTNIESNKRSDEFGLQTHQFRLLNKAEKEQENYGKLCQQNLKKSSTKEYFLRKKM